MWDRLLAVEPSGACVQISRAGYLCIKIVDRVSIGAEVDSTVGSDESGSHTG